MWSRVTSKQSTKTSGHTNTSPLRPAPIQVRTKVKFPEAVLRRNPRFRPSSPHRQTTTKRKMGGWFSSEKEETKAKDVVSTHSSGFHLFEVNGSSTTGTLLTIGIIILIILLIYIMYRKCTKNCIRNFGTCARSFTPGPGLWSLSLIHI